MVPPYMVVVPLFFGSVLSLYIGGQWKRINLHDFLVARRMRSLPFMVSGRRIPYFSG